MIHDRPQGFDVFFRSLGLRVLRGGIRYFRDKLNQRSDVPGSQIAPVRQRFQSTGLNTGEYYEDRYCGRISLEYRVATTNLSSDIEGVQDECHTMPNSISSVSEP